MIPRRLALLASLIAACSDEPGRGPPPDAAPSTTPDAGFAVATCLDLVGNGGFAEEEFPQLWLVHDRARTALTGSYDPGFALSPDRTRIAIGRLFEVRIIALDTGTTTSVPVAGSPDHIDWSTPDPTVVIQGDVWTIDPVAALGRPILGGDWTDARMAPDGETLAAIAEGGLWLRAGDARPTQVLTGVDQILGWTGPDTILAVGGRTVQRYTIGGGAEVVVELPVATDLSLSPDGLTLAFVTAGTTAWFVAVGEPATTAQPVIMAQSVDLLSWASRDEMLVAARSPIDYEHRLWLAGPLRNAVITPGVWSAARVLSDCSEPPPL